MIDKDFIISQLQKILDNDFFIVDVKYNQTTDKIQIYLDRFSKNITLDDCEYVHRKLYPLIEEQKDNFELEISSPGLTTPFKVWQQYYKNIGKKIILVLSEDFEAMQKDKQIVAEIVDADQTNVTVKILKTKKTKVIPYTKIKKATLKIF